MKVSIVHLSDIHFKSDGRSKMLIQAPLISDYIRANTNHADCRIVTLTGDLTFSGMAEEFSQVIAFIDKLKSSLNDKPTYFLSAPGNHDCDFSKASSLRDLARKEISMSENVDDEMLDKCLEPQNNFFSHIARIDSAVSNFDTVRSKLFWSNSVAVSDKKIEVCVINSSWFSAKDEVPGKLFYPMQALNYMGRSDVTITILHHPLHWFDPNIARLLREKIEENSDIVITGHEHISGAYNKEDILASNRTSFIEGGSLDGHHSSDASVFNLIDYDGGKYSVKKVAYNEKSQIYETIEQATSEIVLKGKHTRSKQFPIAAGFRNYLNDLGISFQHPRKEKLTLEDVFVYQDLEETIKTTSSGSTQSIIVKSDSVLEALKVAKKAIITSGKNYGKTSLAKKLFLDLRESQIVPIYLAGSDINSRRISDDEFLKLIEKSFTEQYANSNFELFKQLSTNEKFLIIDDFHFAKLNHKGREKALSVACQQFENMIVIADESFRFDEIFSLKSETNLIFSFKNFQIRQLGKRVKDKIISKWVGLGFENEISQKERIRQQESLLRSIEGILGSKAIPSIPIYILTLLQTVEAAVPTNAISGSHGFMYRYLIETELTRAFRNQVNLNALTTYLSHLMFFIFQGKDGSATLEELEEFFAKFRKEHASPINFQTSLERFQELQIVSAFSNEYRITRNYYLYYFVGKFLAEGLNRGEDESKQIITEFIDSLYVESHANIITCVCYHTQNSFLRDYLLKTANSLFKEVDRFDFKEDVAFLKSLKCIIPDQLLTYESDNIEKERNRLHDIEDETHASDVNQNTEHEPQEGIDQTLNFNYAMKTIGVLGQMLRSYAGQIKAEDQVELAETCFNLSMRSLNFIVTYLSDNADEISTILHDSIKNKAKIEEQDIRNLIYYIAQNVTVNVIERTANSVGAEDLRLVFKAIIEKDGSLRTSFLDYVIKLHYANLLPVRELREMATNVEKNRFALDSLKILMVRFMRINPLDIGERQQITAILKLPSKMINQPLLNAPK